MSSRLCNAAAICVARTAAPMVIKSSVPPSAATATGATPSKVILSCASPAMLRPAVTAHAPRSTRATTGPSGPSAATAMWSASLAKATREAVPDSLPSAPNETRSRGRIGATVMAPAGATRPARASNQPATRVSANGTGTAKAPATRSTAKPSAREAPAPPLSSGTQARVRPDWVSASHSGARHASSAALLMVRGSPRSWKMRVAVSTTRVSASLTLSGRRNWARGARPWP